MKAFGYALAAGLLMAALHNVVAAERTAVRVGFELTDKHYTDEFTDPELEKLRADVATDVTQLLNDRVRYLDFRTDGEAAYRVTLRLGRADGAAAAGPADFGLFYSLDGPDVPANTRVYVLFRGKDKFSEGIDGEELRSAIKASVASTLTGNFDETIQKILQFVPMKGVGEFRREPALSWVIHEDRAELCIDSATRLEVKSSFPEAGGTINFPFPATVIESDIAGNEILTVADEHAADPAPTMLRALGTAAPDTVKVEVVRVLLYRHRCPQASIPPDQASFAPAQ